MARQILPIAGAIIGGAFGAPQLGFAIGSIIGNAVDPLKVQGPKVGDLQVQTSRDGVPRPIVYGVACVAGNIIDRTNPRIVKKKERAGKGGPVTITERAYLSFAVRICEGPAAGISRVWENEKLVYDVTPGSTIPNDSAKFASKVTFYLGDETQMPDPTLEAFHGVGNTPAHRGTCYAVFKDKDVTDTGGAIPQYRFEINGASSLPVVPWIAGTGGTTNIRFEDGTGFVDVSPGGSSKQYSAYLNGNAIVFGNTVLKYSTDLGDTWSADISLSPATATQGGFDFDGTYYYAVQGGNHVGRSSNLTSWSKPLVDNSAMGTTLAIKSGRLMVFDSGSEMAPTYSDNQGASYTTGGNILGLAAFTYGNSILKASASYFVCYCKRDAGGSYAQKITRSADGASWADSGYSFPTNNISTFPIALCHGNGIWVAVNSAGEIAFSTNDAASFNTSGFTATLPMALDHDGQKFILACENGVLVTSTDGNAWSAFATFGTYDFTSIMALTE